MKIHNILTVPTKTYASENSVKKIKHETKIDAMK